VFQPSPCCKASARVDVVHDQVAKRQPAAQDQRALAVPCVGEPGPASSYDRATVTATDTGTAGGYDRGLLVSA
jgi:hypothetical protein